MTSRNLSLSSEPFRTRFAPSPTGYLHCGHAYAAEQVFNAARARHGSCLLRIEDIDPTRCRPGYKTALVEDLHWLGFHWEEPVRCQSNHFDDYEGVLNALREKGLVYRSFLSRKALNEELDRRDVGFSPAGERPYPGPVAPLSRDEEDQRLSEGQLFAWRLSLSACQDWLGDCYSKLCFEETGPVEASDNGAIQAHPEWLGDVIIARKDSPTSYHIAATHDDQLQGITHIVRGHDLYYATHVHVLIQAIMGWQTPVYYHHQVILGEDGLKLSKSKGAKTLRTLRDEGVSPEQIRRDWTGK